MKNTSTVAYILKKPGQYRVSLLKTFKDGFYPGLHLLPDSTIVATTYANYRQEDVGCSIVSVRFKMSEVDALAAKQPRRVVERSANPGIFQAQRAVIP